TAFSANPANSAIFSEASLSQYMGLSLNEEEIHANMTMVSGAPIQDNGIFVQLVKANSPDSLVVLRFGDQVLQINGENCAGWSSDKAHKVLKQAFGEKISMTIHDRPFEWTITTHKDSTGHVEKITSIVKDSSIARNGLLTEHNICEINRQNVIGLKDSQIADILSTSGTLLTITIMSAFIFEHIKWMTPSMKSLIDHTIPEGLKFTTQRKCS
uniref:PDZ domain-containing protein n=1 Tax=Rhinopithecus bieti TaxID=61621 RepID=A0A2K6K2G5_RHIBE